MRSSRQKTDTEVASRNALSTAASERRDRVSKNVKMYDNGRRMGSVPCGAVCWLRVDEALIVASGDKALTAIGRRVRGRARFGTGRYASAQNAHENVELVPGSCCNPTQRM